MFNLTIEQLDAIQTHPVVAYFGFDTTVSAIQQYVMAYGPTLDNDAFLESTLLDMIINDHDAFFQFVEDRLDG